MKSGILIRKHLEKEYRVMTGKAKALFLLKYLREHSDEGTPASYNIRGK